MDFQQGNLTKYTYKISYEVWATHQDDLGATVETQLSYEKHMTINRSYPMFFGTGNLNTTIYVPQGESPDDMRFYGLSNTITNWAHVFNVNNSISKTISKLTFKITNIEAWEFTQSSYYHTPGCRVYFDIKTPITDFQFIEDNIEFRVKVLTYNLESNDFTPQHIIGEINTYNSLNQLTKGYAKDEGTTEYLYTKEGLIRFSQNAVQRNASPKRFSYTNYDSQGRVIETGEAIEGNAANLRFQNYEGDITMSGSDVPISNSTILDNISSLALIASEKNDVSYFYYDTPHPSFSTTFSAISSNYSQTFLWGQLSYSSNEHGTTVYSYDPYGRMAWQAKMINGLLDGMGNPSIKTMDYSYTDRGETERIVYQKHDPSEYFEHFYSYDKNGRLKIAYSRTSAMGRLFKEAEYFYYLHGPLKRVEIAQNLQGIDYIYNTLGYLKAINSPNIGSTSHGDFQDPGYDGFNGFQTDAFGMSLDYFSGDYTRAGTHVNYGDGMDDNHNGNIKAMRWMVGVNEVANPLQSMYRYKYNKNNWLTEAKFGTYDPNCQNLATGATPCGVGVTPIIAFDPANAYLVDNITYDKIGNIQSLRRRAQGGTLMDDFTYNYSTDKVSRLSMLNDNVAIGVMTTDLDDQDPSNAYLETDEATWNYVYDEMGRMTEDKAANQKLIYNSYGLVKEVQKDHGSGYVPLVRYFYDENGLRLSKTTYDNIGTAIAKKWYVGGNEYEQDLLASTTTLQHDLVGSGRLGKMVRASSARTYELNDHLGNVRATVSKSPSGVLTYNSYTDYYPFGAEMPGRKFVSGDSYKHGYQGQFTEKDEEINMDAFELRLWDGRLARWTTTDPANQFWSPYLGMGNNPISGVDPDGAKNFNFDAVGNFTGITKDVWWHNLLFGNRGQYTDVNGAIHSFRFADPTSDAAQIESGIITRLEFVKDADINEMLANAGAFQDLSYTEALSYLKREGVGGGKFDFSYTAIPQKIYWG